MLFRSPKFEDDPTYQRFVSNPPKNSAVVKMNWTDNKYISPELIAEKDDLKARDYDKYLWVWEGHCLKVLDGGPPMTAIILSLIWLWCNCFFKRNSHITKSIAAMT